jgi:hypothetical protein
MRNHNRRHPNERATKLVRTADAQISELIGLLSIRDEAILQRPCPGRQKLGDGTIAACAEHTANNYLRIGEFLRGELENTHDAPSTHGSHAGADRIDRKELLERLSRGRTALAVLAELTDEQLDAVPPASEMKFCDGQRTLEQILNSLLNHQNHQLDALRAAAV